MYSLCASEGHLWNRSSPGDKPLDHPHRHPQDAHRASAGLTWENGRFPQFPQPLLLLRTRSSSERSKPRSSRSWGQPQISIMVWPGCPKRAHGAMRSLPSVSRLPVGASRETSTAVRESSLRCAARGRITDAGLHDQRHRCDRWHQRDRCGPWLRRCDRRTPDPPRGWRSSRHRCGRRLQRGTRQPVIRRGPRSRRMRSEVLTRSCGTVVSGSCGGTAAPGEMRKITPDTPDPGDLQAPPRRPAVRSARRGSSIGWCRGCARSSSPVCHPRNTDHPPPARGALGCWIGSGWCSTARSLPTRRAASVRCSARRSYAGDVKFRERPWERPPRDDGRTCP